MMKKYCQNTAHAGAACVLKRSAFCFGVPMMVNSTYHHVQEDAERSHVWAGKEATQTQNGCREVSHFDPRYTERDTLCGPDEVHLHQEDDDDP